VAFIVVDPFFTTSVGNMLPPLPFGKKKWAPVAQTFQFVPPGTGNREASDKESRSFQEFGETRTQV